MNNEGNFEISSNAELDPELRDGLLYSANQISAIRDEYLSLNHLPPNQLFKESWKTDEGKLIIACSSAEVRGLPFVGERNYTITREYEGEIGQAHDVISFSVAADKTTVKGLVAFTDPLGGEKVPFVGKRPPRLIHSQLNRDTLSWIHGSLDTVLNYVRTKESLVSELFRPAAQTAGAKPIIIDHV